MKKILLGVAISAAVLQGCRKDDNNKDETVQLTVEEQKDYDDAAIVDFMNTHYLDSKGVITAFDSTITTDDNEKKLSDYVYTKLPSGVVYIARPGAQPDPGKVVGTTDVVSFFQVSKTYLASKVNDKITFNNETTFVNNVANSGIPTPDEQFYYYYVKKSVLDSYNKDKNPQVGRDYFEIEGLQEGLKYFKSFDMDNSAEYNMQGVIIVPSRAAYGRDNSIFGTAYSNRSFVFNFQIYNTRARNMETEN